MASWSVVREDLLRRWLDARNRAGRGRGARSRRPCSMCAAATPFVRLREAFPWLSERAREDVPTREGLGARVRLSM